MQCLLTIKPWPDFREHETYFTDTNKGLAAAHAMLESCCPVAVVVYEHETGLGYTKELLNQNNYVRVGMEEPT